MNIVIVLGNGFDLDLGWDTSYKSFYEKHEGWNNFKTNEDDLFQFVIQKTPGNWFDFERTLHEYALHRAEKQYLKYKTDKIERDIQDYNTFKLLLADFITEGSKLPINENSHAYRLLEAYVGAKRRNKAIPSNLFSIKLFSYNYTPLLNVLRRIEPSMKISYIPVHGMVERNNIIFGFHDDPKIPKEYRPIQKSMDENYKSSDIVTASLKADYLIFFGLSLGYIDRVYFKNLFEQISNFTNPKMINKHIVFITKDVDTEKNIKSNLLDMGINLQLLYNSNVVKFIYTDEEQKVKTEDNFNELMKRIYQ